MKAGKTTLWRVPVYCLIAGVVSHFFILWFGGHIAMDISPDNVVSVNQTRALVMNGIIFFLVVFLGGLVFFKGMSRKELFCSASIMVALGLMHIAAEYIINNSAGVSNWFVAYYLFIPFEWYGFVSTLLYKLTENLWIGGVVTKFIPYLFVLFGKRKA